MTWTGDLRDRLLGDATLAGLCGTRIAWFEAARSWDETYPQLVLQEVSPGREYTHNGPDGLDGPRVQFDIYAASGSSARAVEAALLAEMEQDGVTQGSTKFGFGFLQARRTDLPFDRADQSRVQRLTMDFIFYHEAV